MIYCCVGNYIKAFSNSLGLTVNETNYILELLGKNNLANIPCNPEGTYQFGEPHIVNGSPLIGNINCFHRVDLLVFAIQQAIRWLHQEQLVNYLKRLANPKKHLDFLVEFAPLLYANGIKKAQYEESEQGENGGLVDWSLTWSTPPKMLLEVKNRVDKTIIDYFELIDQMAPGDELPVPNTKCESLFCDVERKFRPKETSQVLQGVWINMAITQQRKVIADFFFHQLNPRCLHFAIFNGFGSSNCTILTRPSVKRELIIERLGLTEYRDSLT